MIKVDAKGLKDNFPLFVCYIWDLLRLPPPTKVQLRIAKFMADETHPSRIIQAFRGVGKSYIAYAFVLWKLWNNPDLKFLIVSATEDRANAFSTTCQKWIDLSPFLRHLKPTDRDTTWSKVNWTVGPARPSGSPSVKSVGITSNFTGSRADYIIPDDVESEKNSCTVDQREKLKRSVAEFEAIKKGNEGDGRVSQSLYLGTPQNEESLYNYLGEIGFVTRIWPARYPKIEKIPSYKGKLCPIVENDLLEGLAEELEPTDEKRFTESDLNDRELKYGKAGFSLQFMLDTELSDEERYPLKTRDVIVYTPGNTKAPCQMSLAKTKEARIDSLPRLGFSADRWYGPSFLDDEIKEFEGSVLAVDPSGRGTDEVGYAVVKSLMGYLYVTRAGGLAGGYDDEEVLKPLSIIAKEEKVQRVLIESNFGDGMFLHLWKPILHAIYPCSMEEVRHSGQKEKRIIDTLEPLLARHKLVVSPSVIEHDYKTSVGSVAEGAKSRKAYSLFYQMTHITKDKGSLHHDDRLDALAIGVAYFTERLARDADKEISKLKDQRHEEWLKLRRVKNGNDIKPSLSGLYSNRLTSQPSLLNSNFRGRPQSSGRQ